MAQLFSLGVIRASSANMHKSTSLKKRTPKKSLSIDQAIESLEAGVSRIRQEWPTFDVGDPHICGDSKVLDEFVSFMSGFDGVKGDEFKRGEIIQFSADAGTLDTVRLYAIKLTPVVLGAFIAFMRSKKCSFKFKGRDFSLTVSAPTAKQLERILKVTDRLFLQKSKRKKRP